MKTHKFRGRQYYVNVEAEVSGYADQPANKGLGIYVNPNLGPHKFLEVSVHEAVHACFPSLTEAEVEVGALDISRWLRRLGYKRKVK